MTKHSERLAILVHFVKQAVVGLAVGAVLLTLGLPLPAEAQAIIWIRQFGSSILDQASEVFADASGVYVVGHTRGALPGQTHVGGFDAFVRKYDLKGNELWTRQFGTTAADVLASSVAVDSSGVYVAGSTAGDAYVRKYDLNGNEIWTRQFGTSAPDEARSVSVHASGVYVTGKVLGALPGQSWAGDLDAFVRKYDLDGNEIWTRQFGFATVDAGFAVAVDASGVYVTGNTGGTFPGQTSAGSVDGFVRKYDLDGNEIWTRQFGTLFFEIPQGVAVDASGVYVAGFFTCFVLPCGPGEEEALVRKYDTDGNEIWARQFGAPSPFPASGAGAFGVSVNASGVYIAGAVIGTLPGQTSAGGLNDAYVRKYDPDGNEVWTHQFGTSEEEHAAGVSVHALRVYVAGSTVGTLPGQTNAGLDDAFVVKLAAVTPVEAVEALIADVTAINLKNGIANSLDAKLQNVLKLLEDLNENNNAGACSALQAFVAEVQAQSGIHISQADADALITAAQEILELLGC